MEPSRVLGIIEIDTRSRGIELCVLFGEADDARRAEAHAHGESVFEQGDQKPQASIVSPVSCVGGVEPLLTHSRVGIFMSRCLAPHNR